MKTTKKELDQLTYQIIGAAIEVHKHLGPGLLENVYHKCLVKELSIRKIKFSTEHLVPINYKGLELKIPLRCDLLIEDKIVVELKSVANLIPIFEAQLMTYMKLLEKPKGILINFNVNNIFNEGQRTFVNEIFRGLPYD